MYTSKSLYFNTAKIQQKNIKSILDPTIVRRRAANLFCLGVSLAQLLNTQLAHSFIKNLLLLVQEYEYEISDAQNQKLTKIKKKKVSSKEEQDFYYSPLTFLEVGTYSQLITPNLPFEVDYFEVFQSLMEVLLEIYAKFLQWKPKFGNNSAASTGPTDPTTIVTNEAAYGDAIMRLDAKFMVYRFFI
jgi:hypothetical protein